MPIFQTTPSFTLLGGGTDDQSQSSVFLVATGSCLYVKTSQMLLGNNIFGNSFNWLYQPGQWLQLSFWCEFCFVCFVLFLGWSLFTFEWTSQELGIYSLFLRATASQAESQINFLHLVTQAGKICKTSQN